MDPPTLVNGWVPTDTATVSRPKLMASPSWHEHLIPAPLQVWPDGARYEGSCSQFSVGRMSPLLRHVHRRACMQASGPMTKPMVGADSSTQMATSTKEIGVTTKPTGKVPGLQSSD